MSKTLIVTKYEYLKTVRSKSFWITTLLLPVFMGIVMAVSGYSGAKSEEKAKKIDPSMQVVYVVDEANIISDEIFNQTAQLKKSESLETSIGELKAGRADAVIFYPTDLVETSKITVYVKEDGGIFKQANFASYGSSLISVSVLSRIEDETVRKLINRNFSEDIKIIDKKGNEVSAGLEKFLIPGIFAAIFFFIVFISAQYLLQSVAEEKENRMIEMILSMIKEETLLYGKILGLSLVALTQLLVWVILGAIIVVVATNAFDFTLPISINWSAINWWVVPINLYFIVMGFLFLASIMVGVGSIGTSYKDSQGLSSVFIILSILPIYFMFFIIEEPNGFLSRFLSFFPFTSAMILMVRNSLDFLNIFELLIGMFAVLAYVVIAFKLASIMFNLGSLMYNRRPTFREVRYALRK